MLNTDEGAMERIDKLASQAVATVEATRQEYGKLVNEPDEKALFAALETDWKAYQALHAQLMDMSTKREKFPARKLLEGDGKVLFDKIIVTTKKISEYNQTGATTCQQQNRKKLPYRACLHAHGLAGGCDRCSFRHLVGHQVGDQAHIDGDRFG